MELLRLGTRTATYWVLSLLMLFICLSVNFSDNNPTNSEPINLNSLIKVEPKFLYRSEDKFNAMVVGELKLDIILEHLNTDFSQYNLLVISNLDYRTNTNMSLNWKVNDLTHHVPINLSEKSITMVDFKTKDSSQINNMYILINQETTLGTEHSFQDEISFQAIYLDHQSNHNILTSNFSQWTGFNPIRFSSINSYSDNNNLLYKSLILRLSIWLIGSVILFLLLNIQSKHLFSSLFIAWLITTAIHLNNRLQQNQQIKQSFSNANSNLNLVDDSSEQLSLKIKSALASLKLKPTVKNKIVLIGGNDFFNQRLMYHMKSFNISLNLVTNDLFNAHNPKNRTYIFFENSIIYCNDQNMRSSFNQSVDFIHTEQEFCIARGK